MLVSTGLNSCFNNRLVEKTSYSTTYSIQNKLVSYSYLCSIETVVPIAIEINQKTETISRIGRFEWWSSPVVIQPPTSADISGLVQSTEQSEATTTTCS